MAKLTITRALKELSLLDKRIASAIKDLKPLDVTQGKYKGRALESKLSVEDFYKQTVSQYESIEALINRRTKLKGAIATANASTKVTIAGISMTIAETISRKTFIADKKALLTVLRKQREQVRYAMEESRQSIDKQVEAMILNNVGKDRKADKEDYDRIASPFIEANIVTMVDPLRVDNVIQLLTKEIEDFEAEVDICLSEVNSTTEIDV